MSTSGSSVKSESTIVCKEVNKTDQGNVHSLDTPIGLLLEEIFGKEGIYCEHFFKLELLMQ